MVTLEKKGKLIVVGSGIKAISHFTLETWEHIKRADIVLYSAADPVTELWIKEQNDNSFDFYQYYSNSKGRNITYAQMIERILTEVRAGLYVVAIFYGHPGVFVTPSHNVIHLARAEGFEARMLPAISAEDCLFADLGIDPSVPGLQTYEATDLLLQSRTLCPDANAIIWQVGCVGDAGFNFAGYENSHFQVLVDHLESVYGPDHELINYVAPIFAMGEPQMDRVRIGDLRDPAVAKTVSGISTFFIPAKETGVPNYETARKFGFEIEGRAPKESLICQLPVYERMRELALIENENHIVPEGFKYTYASPALYDLVKRLTLDPNELDRFKAAPLDYLAQQAGITAQERHVLMLNHSGATRMLFKKDPVAEAERFIRAALNKASLSEEYEKIVNESLAALDHGSINRTTHEATIEKWLHANGYLTTSNFVTEALMANTTTASNVGAYLTTLTETSGSTTTYSQGPIIEVTSSNTITVDGVTMTGAMVSATNAMWMASSGNPSNGMLSFSTYDGQSYLQGVYWLSSETQPSANNIVGNTTPSPSKPLSTWNGTYTTYVCANPTAASPTWTQDSTLTVSAPTVTYGSETIQNYVYLDETATTTSGSQDVNEFAWYTSGPNNENAAISFNTQNSDLVFYGEKWTSGTRPTAANFSGTTASNPNPPTISSSMMMMMMMMSSTTSNATTSSTTTSSTTTSSTTTTSTTTTSTTATTTTVLADTEMGDAPPLHLPAASQLSAASALSQRARALSAIYPAE